MTYYKNLYTDYPFDFLGDTAGEIAPIREIKVLSYDDNKYCTILVEGQKTEIKSGYIYTNEARLDEGAIHFNVKRHLMNNLEFSKYNRDSIKEIKRKNVYTVTIVSPDDDFSKDINYSFKNLHKALAFFKVAKNTHSYLILSGCANRKKVRYCHDTWLMEFKDNQITTFITNKRRNECFIKYNHLKSHF